jgi:hypothetical protein
LLGVDGKRGAQGGGQQGKVQQAVLEMGYRSGGRHGRFLFLAVVGRALRCKCSVNFHEMAIKIPNNGMRNFLFLSDLCFQTACPTPRPGSCLPWIN